MPTYEFLCAKCGDRKFTQLPIEKRDTMKVLCVSCYRPMDRQPTAGNFTVKGFNATNGYSKC